MKESRTGGEGIAHHHPEKDESEWTWNGRGVSRALKEEGQHSMLIRAALRNLDVSICHHDSSCVSLLLAAKAETVCCVRPVFRLCSVSCPEEQVPGSCLVVAGGGQRVGWVRVPN